MDQKRATVDEVGPATVDEVGPVPITTISQPGAATVDEVGPAPITTISQPGPGDGRRSRAGAHQDSSLVGEADEMVKPPA